MQHTVKGGGILCGVVFGLDAFLEIVIGPFIASYIDKVFKIRKRIAYSGYIELSLIALSFAFAFLSPQDLLGLILLLFITRLLIIIDSQLKAIFPLYLDNKRILSLPRSLSFHILFQRCIILLSPSLAFLFLEISWFKICFINSFSYLFSLFGTVLILKMIPEDFTNKDLSLDNNRKSNTVLQERKKWISWNCTFMILSSIAFGSVSLILTKHMLLAADDPLLIQVLKGPFPIYIGFLTAWVLTLAFPSHLHVLMKSAPRLCLSILIIGIMLIFATPMTFYGRITIFLIVGILNGINLVGLNAFFQHKIGGIGFTKAVAKSQAFAKMGILLALFWGGLCIDANFAPMQIVGASGILAVFFSIFLLIYSTKLEKATLPIGSLKKG